MACPCKNWAWSPQDRVDYPSIWTALISGRDAHHPACNGKGFPKRRVSRASRLMGTIEQNLNSNEWQIKGDNVMIILPKHSPLARQLEKVLLGTGAQLSFTIETTQSGEDTYYHLWKVGEIVPEISTVHPETITKTLLSLLDKK